MGINYKKKYYHTNLLLFHAWTTSGSDIPYRAAASSKRSNSHFTAGGKDSFADNIVVKKSSTNFWIVPYNKVKCYALKGQKILLCYNI